MNWLIKIIDKIRKKDKIKNIEIEYYGDDKIKNRRCDFSFFITIDFKYYKEVDLFLRISKNKMRFLIIKMENSKGFIKDILQIRFEDKGGYELIINEEDNTNSINYKINKMLYYENKRLLGDKYNKSYRDYIRDFIGNEKLKEQI